METPAPKQIGPYTIDRELGRGGMGVVYLGHDTRLDRAVAIKALPEELAADPARLARFEREARSLAQLSHPNVAGIYGVEDREGHRYLVLEYIEGQTLAERLDRGALLPDEALEIAMQIAAGVEAAHEAGVVHRDLKPGNVIVTPEGRAKVLDFGLARIDEGSSSASNSAFETGMATVTSPAHSRTMPGVILGTAAYMSPEQARGRRVDKRTDIWSFGVMLYEMLTGASPFVGETVSDSIGAVLHKSVDLGRLPPRTPPAVRRTLERCLQRERDKRYRDIGDVGLDLAAARSGSERDDAGDARPIHPVRAPIAAALLVIVSVALGFLVARQLTPETTPAPRETIRFEIPLGEIPESDAPNVMCLSLSGRTVAYVGRTPDDPPDAPEAVCVHDLRTGSTRRLAGTDHARYMSFSPDGSQILFSWFDPDSQRREFRRVPSNGGPVLTVFADETGDQYAAGFLLWESDTELIAASQQVKRLYRVSVVTGGVSPLGDVAWPDDFIYAGGASLVGDRILLTVAQLVDDRLLNSAYLIDLESLKAARLMVDCAGATLLPPDHIVFGRGSTLCVAPLDPAAGTLKGVTTPVLTGLRSPFSFAISLTGDLLAARGAGSGDPTICTVNRQGEVSTLVAKARPFEGQIDVSSDSKHLAATIVPQGGTPTANIIDFDTGFVRPVDVGGFPSAADRFLPDGRLLAVRIYSPNRFEEAIVDPEGVKPLFIPLPLAEGEVCAQRAGQATPDGRYLIFEYLPDKPDMENGLYLVDLSLPDGERHAVPVVATSAQESGPALSPDGKWFAYATDASGTNQVVVRAFDPNHPGARERLVRVSFDGGGHPFWSPDGTELFFLDKNRNIMGVEVTTDPQLAVTPPKLIVDGATMDLSFTWGHQIVDMMPDGQRFVYVRKPQGEDDGVRYEYTLNWAAELGRGASAHASR